MIIVLMGVAGSGKTTVGKLLSQELDWAFVDADDLHPAANKEKMKSGTPLTESDRLLWLSRAKETIEDIGENDNAVFAFPGLTADHRALVFGKPPGIKFVYLSGTFELIRDRMSQRKDHFFPVDLLASQFDLLDPLEEALTIDISVPPGDIVRIIREEIGV